MRYHTEEDSLIFKTLTDDLINIQMITKLKIIKSVDRIRYVELTVKAWHVAFGLGN